MQAVSPSNKPASLVQEPDLEEMVALAAGTPAAGCFLEVGVYLGGSAWHLQELARLQDRALYLYDTFEGIPHWCELDSHQIGEFRASEAEVRSIFPHAIVTRGIFPASAQSMPPVAFAHLDCDQYQSVKDSCQYLRHRMMDGGIILFDDSPCLAGATQAAAEFFGDALQLTHPRGGGGRHYVVLTKNERGIS